MFTQSCSPLGPLEDPGPGPDLDPGHSNTSESCVIKVGPGPEGGWPGRTRVGPRVMDVHSFNLVATATSPAREAAAARHHQLSQPGKSAFKIRAQRPSQASRKRLLQIKCFCSRNICVENVPICFSWTFKVPAVPSRQEPSEEPAKQPPI